MPLLLDDFADSTPIAGAELIPMFLDDKVHIVQWKVVENC